VTRWGEITPFGKKSVPNLRAIFGTFWSLSGNISGHTGRKLQLAEDVRARVLGKISSALASGNRPVGVLHPRMDASIVAGAPVGRDARFFLVHDTKPGKNVPNEYKMHQMNTKCTK
jgi:hypothetical protein